LLAIDLNSDMGEASTIQEFRRDLCLMKYVTSSNISCGAHAGSDELILKTLSSCKKAGTGVGAHPSFRDRRGFGRRELEVGRKDLEKELDRQVRHLKVLAGKAGVSLYHLKPHGALYNMAWRRKDYAKAIAETASRHSLHILAPAGSAMIMESIKLEVPFFREGFVDRNYSADGLLVPRSRPDSIIKDPALAAERALRMVEGKPIRTVEGKNLELSVQSLCVHSDTPNSCGIARVVRSRLESAGVKVVSLRHLDSMSSAGNHTC